MYLNIEFPTPPWFVSTRNNLSMGANSYLYLNPNASPNPLQKIDFDYHVRGGLLGINLDASKNPNPNASENDLFSYKLTHGKNGNITNQNWKHGINGESRGFAFTYDFASRLKTATYSPNSENYGLQLINYDKNGNITHLKRNGKIGGGFNLVDDLTYNYTGNLLTSMTEGISGNHEIDFVPRGNGTYTYYNDGSMQSDANEGIIEIIYDTYLKQPISLELTTNRFINHYYSGDGVLIKTVYMQNSNIVETWDYTEGLIYKNTIPFSIDTKEGRATYDQPSDAWTYEYYYTDHIGNVRSSFKNENGILAKTSETDYDPFNVVLKNSQQLNSVSQRFQIQSHESELTFGLNRVNFGARTYNPTIGRFEKVDPKLDKREWISPYNFVQNNFVNRVDPDGALDVRPNEKAFEAIRNGLSTDDAKLVKLDSKGFLDKKLINSKNSESGNFNALKQLVNDNKVYDIKVTDSFNSKNENGKNTIQDMGAISYNDFLTGEKLTEPEGKLGYTATPGLDGKINSPDSEVKIIVNSGLNVLDQSKIIAHEAYGHAYLYSKGQPYQHIVENVGGKFRDTNIILKTQIKNRINETESNYRKKSN